MKIMYIVHFNGGLSDTYSYPRFSIFKDVVRRLIRVKTVYILHVRNKTANKRMSGTYTFHVKTLRRIFVIRNKITFRLVPHRILDILSVRTFNSGVRLVRKKTEQGV